MNLTLGIALFLPLLTPSPPVENAPPVTRNVAIVVHDGVELLDFAGVAEVLQAAGKRGPTEDPWFRLYTVAPDEAPVVSQGFLKIEPEYTISNCPTPNIVVIPGGRSSVLYGDPEFMEWIRRTVPQCEFALSVSTGVFVLGYAGLLDGREVTTHWSTIEALAMSVPKAKVRTDWRFVPSGNLVTCGGITSGLDGALHIVASTLGLATAERTARYIEYTWFPPPTLVEHYPDVNTRLGEKEQLLERLQLAVDRSEWDRATQVFLTLADRFADDGAAGYRFGLTLLENGQLDLAVQVYRRNVKLASGRHLYNSYYNLACAHALAGDKDQALGALTNAVAAGFQEAQLAREDDDLASLRGDDRFELLLRQLDERPGSGHGAGGHGAGGQNGGGRSGGGR
ncbi:MAG: DJ-1/PfpI family protein [Planctomycetes bacterium]|nr:DJ-1/PfpI family protein [Planctomycetota bacterium]